MSLNNVIEVDSGAAEAREVDAVLVLVGHLQDIDLNKALII